MFSRLHLKLALFTLCCSTVYPLHAAASTVKNAPLGSIAEQQIRHIATYFPGRMAGSPAELLAADYINQRFEQMGYQSNQRGFNTRYLYTSKNGKQSWRTLSATSVIAARSGNEPQQVVIMAHFDTYTPHSDLDLDKNLGGLTLQGVDDNASGVGVMLELAERLKDIPTRYSLRFVALSAEDVGAQGSDNYLKRMSAEEKQNTLLVINLDSLITGDRLYFNPGQHDSKGLATQSRDLALKLARQAGIPAMTRPAKTPETTCRADQDAFDKAGIAVLSVEATNYQLGKKDGCQQRAISPHFPQGESRHQSQWDNLNYLDRHLPGRISKRSRDSVKILLPLVEKLAQAEK
ncbi:aminopeptidase [Yersinia ruckeri]|uniref:aminopeptidase n=1 Tax=Yersinia ruckeri TaxID=29486 RepID=UPI0004E39678|nr:aminopeptidase [Yersinia ruckeri]ARZ02192.1 alkaline phosphatase isozyme conversion aminopeptidase [Yersinia ruckeri]AUQ40873.1 aminopeptidase [Yersinia ruckeri]EKN3346618.1 aminopeptidase [Yersinia ruckeri]EKN3361147.1 aminopeptidase [Yersinia ruckeri]EKN4197145.1 aminopeptidase [Yersinia ruckeri]